MVRKPLNTKKVREKSGDFKILAQNMCFSSYFDYLECEKKCRFFLSLARRYENLLILEHSVQRNCLRILVNEKLNLIREKSMKSQGILFLHAGGHPVSCALARNYKR